MTAQEQKSRTETKPQWTTYKVKPELVGNLTLIIYKNKDGIRQDQSLTQDKTDRLITSMIKNGCSVQRVYKGVDPSEAQCKIFEKYSPSMDIPFSELPNEALDELILQPTTK